MTIVEAIRALAERSPNEADAYRVLKPWCMAALRVFRPSASDAEDVADEVLFRIMSNGGAFACAERPEAYLRRALRNRLFDLLQLTNRHEELDELRATDADGHPTGHGLARRLDGQRLLEAVLRLAARTIEACADPRREEKTWRELLALVAGEVEMDDLIDGELGPGDGGDRHRVRLRILKRHQRLRERLIAHAGDREIADTVSALFIRCKQPRDAKKGST